MLLCVTLTEVICPTPEQFESATLYGDDRMYLSNVTYVCDDGMRFDDGHLWHTLTCVIPGIWTKQLSACDGTIILGISVTLLLVPR